MTALRVIVEDYCLGATVGLSLESLSRSYMPLVEGDFVVSLDYGEIEESFSVDSLHRDVCTPVVFYHRLHLLEGNLDLGALLVLNKETKTASLTIPRNAIFTKFFFLVTGQIMGESDYSSKTHSTLFTIGEKQEVED